MTIYELYLRRVQKTSDINMQKIINLPLHLDDTPEPRPIHKSLFPTYHLWRFQSRSSIVEMIVPHVYTSCCHKDELETQRFSFLNCFGFHKKGDILM